MTEASPRTHIAYQAIRQAIIEQALMPGTKLPEDEIGAHFGVSRTLVRATLARLQVEGLVETQPKRTAKVAQPTLKEAREIFDLRRVLECEAIRLVAQRWRPEFGAELESLVREEEAAKAGGDEKISIRLAGEFHIKLAEMTDNGLLQRYLSETVSRCSLILATYGRPHSSECAINEHHQIIDALQRRDSAAAVAIMDEHIGSVERRAMLTDDWGKDSNLGALLSRYGGAAAASRVKRGENQ